MRYLGLDVHSKATVWCLLDAAGQAVAQGKTATTAPALTALFAQHGPPGELLAGQEVGTQSQFVFDVAKAAGVKLLSFNAQQLRMIASSRKKTDRRDALWIAKALATGMHPHPVYIPEGAVRTLRTLLSQRDAVAGERRRWRVRARSALRAAGLAGLRGRSVAQLERAAQARPDGLDAALSEALALCRSCEEHLAEQERQLEARMRTLAAASDPVQRLQTIPGVGPLSALWLHATIGEVSRFPNARALCSYVGLVPSVQQSGESRQLGGITRQGSGRLRAVLVQCAHVLLRMKGSDDPLARLARETLARTRRYKLTTVAMARHILRVAFYVLRDRTEYDPARVRGGKATEVTAAA